MWLDRNSAAAYAHASPRSISRWVRGVNVPQTFKPLRASHFPNGYLRIKAADIDSFLSQFDAKTKSQQANLVVNSFLREIGHGKKS